MLPSPLSHNRYARHLNALPCMLHSGALIAKRLRQVVFERLQLTCSAGVAHNKILAKLASARHKPNKQALVLPRGVRDMMQVGWSVGVWLVLVGAC